MNLNMEKDIIEKLKQDEHYYGDFGKNYLSNSDIKTFVYVNKLINSVYIVIYTSFDL